MKKSGIKTKVIVFTAVAMTILTAVIAGIGYVRFNDNVLDSYVKYANMVVESAESVFEEYSMGNLIAARQMGKDYENVRLGLNEIKNNADIKYLYAVYFEDIEDVHSVCYAINGKSDEELNTGEAIEDIYSYMGEPCEEDAFEESVLELFQKSIQDKDTQIRYAETETSEYGRLVTCYRVVLDDKGNAVGIVGADIDVNKITKDIYEYLRIVLIVAVVITILMIILFVYLINMFITKPVQDMARSTGDFVKMMDENVAPEELGYDKIQVKGRDEIYMLSEGIESLADGVKNYLLNLRQVTAEKERIGAELNVATQIQADMLPRIFPAFPERKEFDLYATMTPAKEVGGDFYDFFLVDDDHLALVMADVSGKGVPAALFMVIAKTLIKNRAQMGAAPSEVLAYANEQLCEGNEAELFVTVWLAIIEISTGKGLAANAGHEHPAIRRAGGEWELVVYRHSPAVATLEGLRFREHEFELHPGDSLYVYTDGVAEATDASNTLYGAERMLDALNREPNASPEKLLQNVKEDVDAFVGEAPQFDDITMLGLTWYGEGA